MKPIIKQNVAIFSPIGFLDGENAADVISSTDVNFLMSRKPRGAFISLKRVVFFNKRGMTVLIESLIRVRDECGTVVGFCDYDKKKYRMILEMFCESLNFSLFDTSGVVTLFVGDNIKNPKEQKIVIYVKDVEQKNQFSMELYERGFTPVAAKDQNDFLAKREDADYIVENSYLGKLDKTPAVYIKDNVIVYTMRDFVDSEIINKFDIVYHQNSLRVGFKLFLFDMESVSSINIHGVSFISKLANEGAEYGAYIVIGGLNDHKINKKLSNDLEDAGVLVYSESKKLFENSGIIKDAYESVSSIKAKRVITKQIIEVLPVVIESSIKSIEVLSGHVITKKSIKIEELNLKEDSESISVAIGFFGDIEGVMIFIFEKSTAKESCRILLEESSDDEDVLKALGEFTYIIGRKISQQLQKQGIRVDTTMPRTFKSVKDVMFSQSNSRGAQVDFDIDGKDLTLFLTR